jgi:hypothetical protein
VLPLRTGDDAGFLGWLAWGTVHLESLVQLSLWTGVSVFVKWVWTYVARQWVPHLFASFREEFAIARPTFN